MAIDFKNIGLKALDVVVGVSAVVAGVSGGPLAAQGVMMAGGAIKNGINEATGEEPSRADRHDREDFQARQVAVVRKQDAAILAVDDRAAGRAELIKLGWSPEKADLILAGPRDGVTVAALSGRPAPQALPQMRTAVASTEQPPPVARAPAQRPAPVSTEESTGVAGVIGRIVQAAAGTRVASKEGTEVKAVEGTNDSDAYQGTSTLSTIGTLIKSAISQKA